MKVTVAVLTFNEQENIPDIMGSLKTQTFSREMFEVLIVDNGSTDGTLAAIEPFAESMGNVRVVNNPVRGIAPGRNVALRYAKHDLIAYTDADVILPENWLANLVEGYEKISQYDKNLVAVGGGNVPVKDGGSFLDALGVTLNSFWGSHGSTQGMLFERVVPVPHIPTLNILYNAKVLKRFKGFDEKFRMVCEDPELNFRLTQAGYKIYYLPNVTVEHKMRPSLRTWLKNVFTYGRGRTQLIVKHPSHFRLMYLLPPLIVLAFLAVPFSFWQPAFLFSFVYFLLPYFIAYRLCSKVKRHDLFDDVYTILTLNPIAYGMGMFYAIFKTKT